MAAFFAHNRGTVVQVVSRAVAPMPFKIIIAGSNLDTDARAIITQAGIIENGNYQFMHTLNETIYAYVFGDRIGELRVSGLCFADVCGGAQTGMRRIIDIYRENRIANAPDPVQVSFGETDYKGFLVGMTIEVVDPERNIGQWAFRFNTFPGNI